MTALVTLASLGDLRLRSGGEVGPDDVGEVEDEPVDLYDIAGPPADGLTASDDEGDW